MSIIIKYLSHIYQKGTVFEKAALNDINLEIDTGKLVGIIGHTGSGKTTLIHHLNAIKEPTSGTVLINDVDINSKKIKKSEIRKKVGIVFQYPEYQLFEDTIFKDIAYGPIMLGLSEEEVKDRVHKAMQSVDLDISLCEKSPFDISGGQKRRVAIAGILSMNPDILILDEPSAGLDPAGKTEILDIIEQYHKNENKTIIIVTHDMNEVATICDKLYVMNKGTIEMSGTVDEIFSNSVRLKEIGLDIPTISEIVIQLREKGVYIKSNILTIDDFVAEIAKKHKEKNND